MAPEPRFVHEHVFVKFANAFFVREDAVDERDSRRTLFKLANMFTNFTNISRTSREHLANSSRTYAVLCVTKICNFVREQFANSSRTTRTNVPEHESRRT